MNYRALIAAAVATLALPASALTVHTSQFIFAGTNYTGFEGLGPITASDGVTSYSEDGIAVNYVGSGAIWSESQSTPDGVYSWYPDGGGYGYTAFTFDDVQGFQLLVNSGWGGAEPVLSWEVLLDGTVIGTGSLADFVSPYGGEWKYFGFSDATFDEVRLQVTASGSAFDPSAYEAGAYDAVSLTQVIEGGVPEPATWAMLIAGFGLVGTAMRRRPAVRC